ncbi:PAS domain-containing sensor histidine kinase [Novosphingobium kaempferiae]|uniref:PAS domain-containing sensor histidine kinase n=1 Tax=Novosphingobium kaempferiae TaxID=2896849 RepID=UPI001E5FA4E4|nr:PAS domain S-box protein [Novosphingobium kaempferiae]
MKADVPPSSSAADGDVRCLSDIERLNRLAMTWAELDPTAIVGSALDTLLDMLALDFIGLRFSDGAHVFLRVDDTFAREHAHDAILGIATRKLDGGVRDEPVTCMMGGAAIRVLQRRLGTVHSLGTFILGSRRAGFPDRNDLLRLDVAAAQAGLACREVREFSDRQPPDDDRTERPLGEALAESEWRLNLIINTIPALAWSTTADGMLDFCNKNFLDYVGYTFEELSGLGFYPIFHPDDLPHILSSWQEIMASRQHREVEGRIRRADGEYRWFTMRQNPLFDVDGQVIKWYGVGSDIEDRKRAEHALKEVEAALQASEQNLNLIINSLPVLVWSARPDGSADFVNQSWLDYAGVPVEELLDWGFVKLFHPDDVDRMLLMWGRDLATAEHTRLKGRILGADGRYRWFLFSGGKVTEANGVVRWYGVNVDIEDLERAEIALRESEAALKESERQLNLVVHTIPAMAWSAMPNGMLDFWNRHFVEYVGLSMEQVRGFGFYQIFHPDDLEYLRASWEETLSSKTPKPVDGRIRRADGEYRWFTLRQAPLLDAEGNVIKWFGVVFEIEDRKRAEIELHGAKNALLASEARLNQIISSIPGLAWSSDANGATTFWSQRYLDYAGLAIEEILGFGFTSQFHPDDREHLMEVWDDTLKSGLTGEAEGRLRGADGQYRWFLIRASPFFDADGNLTQWFGVNIDIDDRKRAEEQLRQSQSDLAHVTRVMTMGELAVSIAHEINQPLMAIVTNAGTCLRWLDAGQLDIHMARKAAERIVRDGHRAGDIVASIRALAQKSVARMEAIDLEAVIDGVVDLLRGELQRRKIVFDTDFHRSGTMVLGDPTQLQQVVLNLVMNGAEAMSQVDESSRRIVIRADIIGKSAQICVLDTGTGLSGETRDNMFEAFYSTKPKGIGMGLAICRSIVEAHGGRIWASDNVPQGSVFTFTLPLADRPALVAPGIDGASDDR